ncbi:MAG: type II secretion system protein [Proteobacteria bacterium]|nr:type II secretion system protein [Pseudomonadota bacterium]
MNKRIQKGFTLIEVSIVILIMGLLLTGGLVTMFATSERGKTTQTAANLANIQDALAIFLAMNGRLPCPAGLSQTQDSSAFGIEQTSGSNPMACNTASGLFSGTTGGETQYYGMVPVRTLGLSDASAIDGFGNRIVYVVQNAFVNNATTNTSCVTLGTSALNSSATANLCYRGQASPSTGGGGGTGGLVIADASGNTISTDAVYVLISYGANGYGAYISNSGSGAALQNGLPLPNSIYANEYDNLNCNPTTFVCSSSGVNNVFVQATTTNTFDDIVYFETRNNLLTKCNKYAANACFIRHGITIQ